MTDYNWGGGAKGAAGGALAGGSIGGPAGALIGGAAGGALGLFGGDNGKADYQNRLQQYYNDLANRQAPQAGPASQSGYSGFRQNQSDMIKRLEALSQGQGPSLAAQQFQQANDSNVRNQQAMANSGRNGPMGAFNAANNMGMLGAQAAQGSATARTQEEQMALQQLGLSLYGARGADEETNRFNAGEQNKNSLANLDARLKAMGMGDQARLGILQQMGGGTNGPQIGDQLLAGGAGMFAQSMAMGKGKPGGPGMAGPGLASGFGVGMGGQGGGWSGSSAYDNSYYGGGGSGNNPYGTPGSGKPGW